MIIARIGTERNPQSKRTHAPVRFMMRCVHPKFPELLQGLNLQNEPVVRIRGAGDW